jgi:hypothetical protein
MSNGFDDDYESFEDKLERDQRDDAAPLPPNPEARFTSRAEALRALAQSETRMRGKQLSWGGGKFIIGFGNAATELKPGGFYRADLNSHEVALECWINKRRVNHVHGRPHEGYLLPSLSELPTPPKSQWDRWPDGRQKNPWQRADTIVLVGVETQEVFTFVGKNFDSRAAITEMVTGAWKDEERALIQDPIIKLSARTECGVTLPELEVVRWVSNGRAPPPKEAPKSATPKQLNDDVPF